jgi:hypothetical protein
MRKLTTYRDLVSRITPPPPSRMCPRGPYSDSSTSYGKKSIFSHTQEDSFVVLCVCIGIQVIDTTLCV